MGRSDRLVWISLRTRGPDPELDPIESVRLRITDGALEVVADPEPFAVGEEPAAAEARLMELVSSHVRKGKGLLAGLRVQEVRLFLAEQMPALFAYLHYRNIDVGTVRELVRRWYPEAYAARPRAAAGDDEVARALEELRHYRRTVFVEASPGAATEGAEAAGGPT